MKAVAAVFADFSETFLGGPSQLLTDLAGRPILRRMLERLRRVNGLDRRCLFVRARDQAVAESVLRDWGFQESVDVLPHDPGVRPRRELIRSARKWSLDAWRGGVLGTTWFDEFVEPPCVARVLNHYGCESVLCLDGHMPVLDVAISSALLEQERDYEAEQRMSFTQAPPGLAGILLHRVLVQELLDQGIPVGLMLAYRPETPRADPINQPSCVQIEPGVAQTAARLTGDTRRSRELLSSVYREMGEDVTAAELCAWLRLPGHDRAGGLPVEVELELTTDDPLPETTLRPRGARVPRRQLTNPGDVERVARELAAFDDRLIVLGGHGDPLLHPGFGEVCDRIRSAGVCGLAVETTGVELSDDVLAALFRNRVDIALVRIDANTPETYRKIHGVDCYSRVLANIERIEQMRRAKVQPQPILLCSLTRCAATLHEMEAFYDRWVGVNGWAVIEGYNEFCGLLPSDPLLFAGPLLRGPCRRLSDRMTLLADGAAVTCKQDVRGEQVVGQWLREGLGEIWRGTRAESVRAQHAGLELEALVLCARCREWFRP